MLKRIPCETCAGTGYVPGMVSYPKYEAVTVADRHGREFSGGCVQVGYGEFMGRVKCDACRSIGWTIEYVETEQLSLDDFEF